VIHFSSDHHFYHVNILRYCDRPYKDVEHMNEDMIARWNSVVATDDVVYYLGDFSMAARPAEIFTRRLNGFKYLIHGNHDFTHPHHKKSRTPENQQKWIELYKSWGWESVQDECVIERDGMKLKLNHMPYPFIGESEHEDKYAKYRPVDDGTILLHGHIHEKGFIQRSSSGTLMINVGVDVNHFFPVSMDRILEIVKNPGV
jgi:calcineurin-like phosphoesterase family protein